MKIICLYAGAELTVHGDNVSTLEDQGGMQAEKIEIRLSTVFHKLRRLKMCGFYIRRK